MNIMIRKEHALELKLHTNKLSTCIQSIENNEVISLRAWIKNTSSEDPGISGNHVLTAYQLIQHITTVSVSL